MTLPSDIAPIRALQDYLKNEILDLQNIVDEFPSHSEEMKLPCCSIITAGSPVYLNLMPYEHSREEDPENALNDIFKEVIGQIDGRIQIDIWTAHKIQRSVIKELIVDALNKEYMNGDLPAGLRLTMPNYHNAIASFDMVGYNYLDTEEGSRKKEWRMKIDLLFCSPVIKVKSVPRISEIEIQSDISDNDNTDTEEITII